MRLSLISSVLFLGLVFAGCDSNDLSGGTSTPSDLATLATALGCATVLPTSPGQTHSGSLASNDCSPPFTGDNSKIDFYGFRLTQSMNLTINLESSDFDSFLVLFNSSADVLETDDDSGVGLDSRITTSLEPGLYAIGANSAFTTADLGSYTLSVSN